MNTQITKNYQPQVSTATKCQSDRFGQDLPLVGTGHLYPAAPFDGGCAF